MRPQNLFVFTVAAFAAVAIPSASFAADAAAGKKIYEMNCFSCHGATGKGDGPVGAALNPPPRDFSKGDFKFDSDKNGTPGTDDDLELVIQKGAGAFGGSMLMAPWPTLSDDDVANVIAYIRTLKQ
jgi:mono/diheme cytochrome c family protein